MWTGLVVRKACFARRKPDCLNDCLHLNTSKCIHEVHVAYLVYQDNVEVCALPSSRTSVIDSIATLRSQDLTQSLYE